MGVASGGIIRDRLRFWVRLSVEKPLPLSQHPWAPRLTEMREYFQLLTGDKPLRALAFCACRRPNIWEPYHKTTAAQRRARPSKPHGRTSPGRALLPDLASQKSWLSSPRELWSGRTPFGGCVRSARPDQTDAPAASRVPRDAPAMPKRNFERPLRRIMPVELSTGTRARITPRRTRQAAPIHG